MHIVSQFTTQFEMELRERKLIAKLFLWDGGCDIATFCKSEINFPMTEIIWKCVHIYYFIMFIYAN